MSLEEVERAKNRTLVSWLMERENGVGVGCLVSRSARSSFFLFRFRSISTQSAKSVSLFRSSPFVVSSRFAPQLCRTDASPSPSLFPPSQDDLAFSRPSPTDIASTIASVTPLDIQRVARRVLQGGKGEPTVVAMGPGAEAGLEDAMGLLERAGLGRKTEDEEKGAGRRGEIR